MHPSQVALLLLFLTLLSGPRASQVIVPPEVNTLGVSARAEAGPEDDGSAPSPESTEAPPPADEATSAPPADPADCPLCDANRAKIDQQSLEQIHLDIFKQKLLEKLGMQTRPPPMKRPHRQLPLDKIFPEGDSDHYWSRGANSMQNDRPRRQYDSAAQHHVKDMFIFSNTSGECSDSSRQSLCLTFVMPPSLTTDLLVSAELWMYRLAPQAVVTEINTRVKTIRVKKWPGVRSGWQKFRMTKLVRRWLRAADDRVRGVKVDCGSCKRRFAASLNATMDDDKAPFLYIRLGSPSRRARRDADRYNSGCRVVPFVVDFRTLGWDDFIYQPLSVRVNFCNGTCSARSGVGALLTRFAILRHYPDLSACCAPVRTSSTNILYINQEGGAILHRNLTDLIVDECGCYF